MAVYVDAAAQRLLSSCCIVSLPTRDITPSGAGDTRLLPTCSCAVTTVGYPDAITLSGSVKGLLHCDTPQPQEAPAPGRLGGPAADTKFGADDHDAGGGPCPQRLRAAAHGR